MTNRDYVIITPCRDEADFARRTLDSIERQSEPPALWVIVDDGSTDETPEILAEYAARLPYIRILRREDRGKRSVGPGVIDAFYAGLEMVELSRYPFVCKMDLDLDLPEHYFRNMLDMMEADERLGTCSGKAYYPSSEGELVSEGVGDEMSVGALKFYRTACFEQIGGFVREVMWDGIDCHRCRMLGWKAMSRDEAGTRVIHLRPMGSSDKGIWRGRKRHGFGQYFMGTGPVYMTASALFRMTKPPFVMGGLAMWLGYMESLAGGVRRYEDPAFRRFLHRYQRMSLMMGKARATARLHEEGARYWRRPEPRTGQPGFPETIEQERRQVA